jgi:Zn-dependent protease
MFGIDVRVNPWFWLVTVLMGWGLTNAHRGGGLQLLLLWVVCVFVSILIHELGHVVTGRLFGSHGHILLYSFGGLAIGSSDLPSRWQRIAVYLAGPLADFLFFGIVLLGYILFVRQNPEQVPDWAATAIGFLFIINVFWGVVNLVPVWPLDGGQISRELCDWLMPKNGMRVSLLLSIISAIGIAIFGWLYLHSLYLALFFGLLAFSSLQLLQQLRSRYQPDEREELAPWERDPDYWKRG